MVQHDLDEFLEEFWVRFAAAESDGDFSRVAHMCADNLVFQSPSEEPYETLDALVANWWTPPADYQIEFDTVEVVSDADLAIARGIASDTFSKPDGASGGHRYNYMAAFWRSPSGWKLSHFISNMIE